MFWLVILLLIITLLYFLVQNKSQSQESSTGLLFQNPTAAHLTPQKTPKVSESEFMNCPMCGEEIKSVAIKCKHCGSLLAVKGSVAQDGMVDGTLGLVSLISGIVGFFIGILLVHFGVLLGLTAVVCGVLGFGKGQKYSLPGIVIGIAAVLFSLIYSYMSMDRFPPLIF